MTDTPDIAQILATAQAVADTPDADAAKIKAIAVETVSAFEARLQHHFARGPFFVKLRNKLQAGGHAELAQTTHQYYLAANVLKHGGGKSLRELEGLTHLPFTLITEDGLTQVDVTADGFLGGLVTTLQQAHDFLSAG